MDSKVACSLFSFFRNHGEEPSEGVYPKVAGKTEKITAEIGDVSPINN